MLYIKVAKVFEKLKKAMESYSPVIIMAAAGWGKSASVQYFFRRMKSFTIYCKNGRLSEMPALESIRSNVIIIEDMHYLKEESSVSYLKSLLIKGGRSVIMITRGRMPEYLQDEDMKLGFIKIVANDLIFERNMICDYLEKRGVDFSSEDVDIISGISGGYVSSLYFCSKKIEEGEGISRRDELQIKRNIYNLWDKSYKGQLKGDLLKLCLSLCQYEEFDEDMARSLSSLEDAALLMDHLRESLDLFISISDEKYALKEEFRAYFLWKQDKLWSKEAILNNLTAAGEYFEKKGDSFKALKYYKLSDKRKKIEEILIQSIDPYKGFDRLIKLKDHYSQLPEEMLYNTPLLMAALSMLLSMSLKPEGSEEWYDRLCDLYSNENLSPEDRKDIRSLIAYLDIALPHRGTKKAFDTIREVFILFVKGEVKLPEFNVTGNMPSVINGGLDFCEWSKNDTRIVKLIGRSVESITGKYSKGILDISLAESRFERASSDSCDLMTELVKGYESAMYGGRMGMCFASVAIQIKLSLLEGDYSAAKHIYSNFRKKTAKEKAEEIYDNLEAFGVWLSLYGGQEQGAEDYINKVEDVMVDFNTCDRYRQMIKLKCLISKGRLIEALRLSIFLEDFCESYQRHHDLIEALLLKSLILYRMKNENYYRVFDKAIKMAFEFSFVRIVSLEGNAILVILEEYMKREKPSGLFAHYIDKVWEECGRISLYFPDYLRNTEKEDVEFTKREMQVLTRLCMGLSTDKICEELGISYAGLKKHNRNIYKKLGAKDRADAERKAIQSGIVHRGKQYD
ncbi:MAG: LuxR C-terminal-related transcriptional regulator [Lachnospiraceae bacterium]|nr:LuxR C-terminal-related transcriptional regulator [Lachnospiraceae bacterium]